MSMRDNVESAMKSLELEGFEFTDEEKAVFEKVANGEVALQKAREEFIQNFKKKYHLACE